MNIKQIKSVEEITSHLSKVGYISNLGLSTSIYLLIKLKKPILLEGEAGVGKTELAKSLSKIFNKQEFVSMFEYIFFSISIFLI